MDIKQASVLVSALLVLLAPALTQAMTMEEATDMACEILPDGIDVPECSRPSSSGRGDSSTRKKRDVNNGHSGFTFYYLKCPFATDQSAIYKLNENPIELDVVEFATEIMANQTTFECLFRENFLSGEPPRAIVEEFVQQSKETCPSTVQRLVFYESVRFLGTCIVLHVGDEIRYEECTGNPFCKGCQQPSKRFNREKRCITQYRSANFWAYCPLQPFGQRLVRDKIIIPVACNCLVIPCERVFLMY